MTDIHTHILPNIDDGAADAQVSQKILSLIKNSGCDNVVFTPHYYCVNTVEDFQKTIKTSLDAITTIVDDLDVKYKVGSEIYISHCLEVTEELKRLAITDTKYILIELSFAKTLSSSVFDKLYDVINYLNLKPVIAHIERYPIILSNPIIAYKLKQQGCVLQLNSSSLFSKRTAKLARALIKHNLIDIIGSDVHNDKKRPFTMPKAFELILNEFGEEVVDRLVKNADNIFNGKDVDAGNFTKVRKFLGFYF